MADDTTVRPDLFHDLLPVSGADCAGGNGDVAEWPPLDLFDERPVSVSADTAARVNLP